MRKKKNNKIVKKKITLQNLSPVGVVAKRGKSIGSTTLSRDLTDQKKLADKVAHLNQELVETTQFLNNVLESSTEYSIIAMDLAGRILTWNAGARRNYGYTTEEAILKMNIQDLHIPEDIESGRVQKFFALTRKTGKAEGIFERIQKNGQHFTASIVMNLRKDIQGHPIGYLLISKDITKQKNLESQLKKNRELQEQNKRIQEANRLKSEFLANMSHEIRTPLNGIIGFAELMYSGRVGPISAEHKEYLGDILSSSRHLLQLINDVLDLAKVEAGKMEFHPIPVDLVNVINEVTDILRTLLAKKQLKLTIQIDPTAKDVIIDSGKLKQILYNYISNAIKFTQEKGKIDIRVSPDVPGKFKLEVIDTGIGIRKENINKLFIEFEQLNENISEAYPGTGLGLALTRHMVEAQGGYVGVTSTYGKGSNFFAVLPCVPLQYKALPESKIKKSTVPSAIAPTVLVIEDEPSDQLILVDALNNAGFVAEVAATGAEALERAKKRRFDAITLDLMLSDMSGWDVLHALRTSSLNQQTPTIVVSVVAKKAASFGFMINDFLVKPVKSSELVSALERAGVTAAGANKKVLVIDHDPNTLRIAKQVLQENDYHVICKSDGLSGLQAAKEECPDIIVLDPFIPSIDGFDFLRRFRGTKVGKHTPVIVWTVKNLSSADIARLKKFAQAVVHKGDSLATSLLSGLDHYMPLSMQINKLKKK